MADLTDGKIAENGDKVIDKIQVKGEEYYFGIKYDSERNIINETYFRRDEMPYIQTAAKNAENVNAQLEGNILTVTNRSGEQRSINLTDSNEHITVNISTTVEAANINNITIYVYINNGETPYQYTSDDNNQIEFTVEKGSTYKITFPYIEGCATLNPITYIASVGNRIIDIIYKEAIETYEAVTVALKQENEDGTNVELINKTVTVTINKESTEYSSDSNGKVTFNVPIGTSYTVSTNSPESTFELHGRTSFTRTASAFSIKIPFYFKFYQSGIWLVDNQNKIYSFDDWEGSGNDSSTLMFVKVTTKETQMYQGDIYISFDMFNNWTNTTKQWCSQNIAFNSIPINGMNTADISWSKFAYNGLLCTQNIVKEAKERELTVPAFTTCYNQTVESGGITYQGYLPTIYQLQIFWANIDSILTAVQYRFPNLILNKSMISGYKWSSTQQSTTYAWFYSTFTSNGSKLGNFLVVPFCAPLLTS